MPGFGEDPFGDHLFGMQALQLPPRRKLDRIPARKFDPVTRTFVVDSAGRYESQSPIAQWVALQIAIVAGTIPSSPASGNPALRHKYLNAGHKERVRADLEQLLQTRVRTGEILVHDIAVNVADYGTIMGVEFTDLTHGERVTVDNRPRQTAT